MVLHLKSRDFKIILTCFAGVLAASFLSLYLSLPIQVELLVDLFVTVSIMASLYFVYKGATRWGGQVARYSALIALGLTYYGLTLIPHVYWHLSGTPSFLGLNAGAITGFQHTATIIAFLIPAYGFYLFWRSGKK